MSIVIIVLLGGDALRRCLRALAQQTGVEPPEIVVPFDDAHPDVDALGREFPNVRFIRVTGRHTYAELRTIGVRETKGEIVALLEDHCVPDPRWAAELVEAHRQEYAAVGGPVDKLTPDSAVNWSLYLADYVRYARPMPAGPVDHLTDCNVSYKRSAIDAIADVWRVEFHEPEVHAALQARGGTLWLSPGVLV
ncbi:MAG TPA: glycosyltransferase family 2 protein, partial [Rhodothermales bacterium]